MNARECEPLMWAAIGMDDAAGLITRELERPEPDAGEVKRQLCRAQRCVNAAWDALMEKEGEDGIE